MWRFNISDLNNKKRTSVKDKLGLFYKNLKGKFNKNILKNKSKFNMKEALTFMIITFAFGMIIGGVIMYGKGSFNGHISKSLDEFITTYYDILNTYYEELDPDELLESGLSGMISYLGDPYASYMSLEETKAFNETVEGEYCGIGAEITYIADDKIVKIGNIFENSPAAKSGLKTDDILLEVNKKSIDGMTVNEIASLVKGKKGTIVNIKVKRNDKEMDFDIKRDNVDIASVKSEIYHENNKKIGYLGISIFANNTDEQFKKEIEKLEKEKIDSLIIDVRGNSGGYLTSVTNIMSMFMKDGTNIYQLKTKDKIEIIKDKTKEKRNYPIIVLANGGSASASELLCAALQENYGAIIIGTKTFGKGKVQKAYELSNGSMIKYTFQEWMTPNGNSIDSVGIEPNIYIEYVYEQDALIDNQLKEAIKEISK